MSAAHFFINICKMYTEEYIQAKKIGYKGGGTRGIPEDKFFMDEL
jgi:hypothetical protein